MNDVSYNNLPEAVEGLYRLFDEIKHFQDLLEAHLNQKANSPPQTQFLTRTEAAKLLGVSLPTLSQWTKTGQVKGYRIARKVRYIRSEVESSLKLIHTNNKR